MVGREDVEELECSGEDEINVLSSSSYTELGIETF
jgi:hypothetical protein